MKCLIELVFLALGLRCQPEGIILKRKMGLVFDCQPADFHEIPIAPR